MVPTVSFRMMRWASALVVLVCAVVALAPLSLRNTVLPDTVLVDALSFYGVTAAAYVLLPFVRRGDVAIVAMWIVLGVGVAPCFSGQEISASHMFADMAGVLMAAGPVYIARFRQVAQGDVRARRRREIELSDVLPILPAIKGRV
ncbi:hypothetical protein [Phenylobacterium sp.]|uniref:hypothetical protein n=1 Tax=Phenylobacterium sp. TaxID=1871053 RepID=UPI00121E1C22|nr:hypothetical protein [Phenylobacterium sp.]THD64731.1 MAG: hypothetical protein E8A49_01405 [Phenylobacterium sp.]